MYEPIQDKDPVLAKDLGRSDSWGRTCSFGRAASAAPSCAQSAAGGGRSRSRGEPSVLAQYAGRILLTVVVSAILLSDLSTLTTPVDRFISKHRAQALTHIEKRETVQFRIPNGAAPGGLVHILLPGSDTPQEVEIPKTAVPGEMMTVQVPVNAQHPKLAAVEGEGKEFVQDVETGNVGRVAKDVEYSILFSLTHYILVIFVVLSGLYIIYMSAVGVLVGFGPLEVEAKHYQDHPARYSNEQVRRMAEESRGMTYDTPRPGSTGTAGTAGAEGKSNLNRFEQYSKGGSEEQKAVDALREEGAKLGKWIRPPPQSSELRDLFCTRPVRKKGGEFEGGSQIAAQADVRKEQTAGGKEEKKHVSYGSPREEAAYSPRSGGGGGGGGGGWIWGGGRIPRGGVDFAGNETIWEVWGRGKWLAVLMLIQSFSSTIFAAMEDVVRAEPVAAMFMTMLVGVGCNAGAQAVIRSVQKIAAEGYSPGRGTFHRQLEKEFPVSVWLGLLLAWFACAIVWTGSGGPSNAVAIAFSCGVIVMGSVLMGCVLPFACHRFEIDVIHSGAVMQVLAGVWAIMVTYLMCSLFLLPAPEPQTSG